MSSQLMAKSVISKYKSQSLSLFSQIMWKILQTNKHKAAVLRFPLSIIYHIKGAIDLFVQFC